MCPRTPALALRSWGGGGSQFDGKVVAVIERESEAEYLKRVERLATDVAERASGEGWLTYLPDDADLSPLQRSINELARNLRHVHFDGDGCLNPDDGEPR